MKNDAHKVSAITKQLTCIFYVLCFYSEILFNEKLDLAVINRL